MSHVAIRVLVAALLVVTASPVLADDTKPQDAHWPQFRGPQGGGIASGASKLPVHFGLQQNVLWKTPLPQGASSPCVWGKFIFLTGFDKDANKLETLCLDRHKGQILWRRTAPAETIEKVHSVSSPAVSTPATDGERVYVYFGSYGLLCYDFQGTEQWKLPLPVPVTRFGTGTSPMVAGDLLVLNCEYLPKPYLLAVHCRTGTTVWKQERLPFMDGYATPVLWSHAGEDEVIIHSPKRVSAHRLKDGAERWWVKVDSSAESTPVVADGCLFVASFALGGEASDRVKLPTFDELLKKYDKNNDGRISKEEFPPDLSVVRRADAGDIPGADVKLIQFFDYLDVNKDGQINRLEWAVVLAFAAQEAEHGVLAIKPGGQGDVSKTHVLWKEKKAVPEVPSPLYYQGRLYTVRDGGVVSCLDPKTGKLLYRERLGPGGAYFSSPVAGDGKLYAASLGGVVVVFGAGDTLQVLARNDLKESILATPALVDGKLYVRTEKHLFAFGE